MYSLFTRAYIMLNQVAWVGKAEENPDEKTLPLPLSLAKVGQPPWRVKTRYQAVGLKKGCLSFTEGGG